MNNKLYGYWFIIKTWTLFVAYDDLRINYSKLFFFFRSSFLISSRTGLWYNFSHTFLCKSRPFQAASAVASATMTPLNTEAPPNKLLELVAKVGIYTLVVIAFCAVCFLCNLAHSVLEMKARNRYSGSEQFTGSCSGERWDVQGDFFICTRFKFHDASDIWLKPNSPHSWYWFQATQWSFLRPYYLHFILSLYLDN